MSRVGAVPLEGVDLTLVATVGLISSSFTYTGPGGRGRNAYPTIESFVLEHGRMWIYDGTMRGYERGQPQQCFANAGMLVMSQPGDELTYVEGYAMRDDLPLPIYHAWAVDGQGRVIDTTWCDRQKRSYLGVPFNFSYLSRTVFERESWGPLILQAIGRTPLLTGEHTPEMAVQQWPK